MTTYNYVIKLGSSNTEIIKAGDGVILIEPSVVAVNENNEDVVVGAGTDAISMSQKNNNLKLVYPVSGGIKNKSYAVQMLRMFLKKVDFKAFLKKNNVAMLIPSSVDSYEKNEYVNVGYSCMFSSVALLPELMAGMVNMEIEEYDVHHYMLCKLGGGTTDVGVVSQGCIIDACTVDLGGKTIDTAIKNYLHDSYNVVLTDEEAERIKIELATLLPNDNKSYKLYGHNKTDGEFGEIVLTSGELRPIFIDYFTRVADVIKSLIANLDAPIVAEVNRRGIYLFGALSSITGVERFLSNVLSIPAYVDIDPESTIIDGSTSLLNSPDLLNSLIVKNN